MKSEWTSWAEARDEVLARLAQNASDSEPFYGFREQLLELCAEVVARSRGGRLVFVGRSPENVYDLLRGLFSNTRGAPSRQMLPFSFRDWCPQGPTREPLPDDQRAGLREHLQALRLDPRSLVESEQAVTLVDCVCWGTTLGNLEAALRAFAADSGLGNRGAWERVRYLGLVKSSAGWTYWRQDAESGGDRLFAEGRAEVVSISPRLWTRLAGWTPKTTESYVREKWTAPPRLPPLDKEREDAIALSVDLLCLGYRKDVRREFARKLARRAKKGQGWLHRLIAAVLRSTQLKKRSADTSRRTALGRRIGAEGPLRHDHAEQHGADEDQQPG